MQRSFSYLRPLVCLLFSGVLLASCKKDTTPKTFDPNNALSGQWKWVLQTDAKAINGIPFDTLTPQNTGYTEFLNMYGDSSWTQVRNGHTIQSGTYKLSTLLSPEGPITTLDMAHNGQDSLINHSISHDTLYTSNMEFAGTYTVRVYVK